MACQGGGKWIDLREMMKVESPNLVLDWCALAEGKSEKGIKNDISSGLGNSVMMASIELRELDSEGIWHVQFKMWLVAFKMSKWKWFVKIGYMCLKVKRQSRAGETDYRIINI